MAIDVENAVAQSVLALERPATWKALESFAEYGSWHEARHLGLDSPDRDCPGSDLARLMSRPSMTPRSMAPAPRRGPVIPTTTLPAAPIAPAPSPATGRPRRFAPRTRGPACPASLRQAIPAVAVADRT